MNIWNCIKKSWLQNNATTISLHTTGYDHVTYVIWTTRKIQVVPVRMMKVRSRKWYVVSMRIIPDVNPINEKSEVNNSLIPLR